MQLPGDYHVHTVYSDGTGLPEDYARKALDIGLWEFALTDHQPLSPQTDNWHMAADRLADYVLEIEIVQRLYPQLEVRMGLELEYWPGIETQVQRLAGQYKWDLLIGSVHFVGDFNVDNPEQLDRWATADVDEVWRAYFELLAAAAASGWYDIIGHADLVKKFGHRPEADPTPWYRLLVDAMQAGDTALEINSGGRHRPCQEPYPGLPLLEMACAAEVPITFGSDAHAPERLGEGLPECVALARQAGYTTWTRLKNREKISCPLPV